MFFGFELELPLGAHILLAFIFGLAIGSFLNVMIHRVPRGETLALPASRCPTCRTPLKPYDNLPLLSYFLQHGRCRYCPALISPRYPLVEFLTALLFATLVWRNGLGWVVLLQMLFVAVMIALIFIDAEHQLLPDLITYPAYLLALAAAALQSGWGRELVVFSAPEQNTFPAGKAALYGGLILAGAAPSFFLLDVLDVLLFSRYFADEEQDEDGRQAESEELAETPVEIAREARRRLMVNASLALGIVLAAGWVWLYYFAAGQDTTVLEQAYRGLARAFVGALVGAGVLWGMRAAYFLARGIEGLGLGDVKMMAVVGAYLGWQGAFSVLIIGSILGALFGLVLAWSASRGLKTALPFGVCLGIAAIWVMFGR